MKKAQGIAIARRFHKAARAHGFPIERVVLFGSVARDEATEDSDLDLAIICRPFAKTRTEENVAMRRLSWTIDKNIEPFCLHADDFNDPAFGLPHEVLRDGVEV